jgi:TolB-like protein
LIAAWALELTPDGLKLEKDVDRSSSITPTTGKKLNSVTIGLLALAVVVLLVDKFYLGAGDASSVDAVAVAEIDKSIAVLPFADLSEGQDQEWFADGLAEEILNALAKTPDLLVASRTSTFAYKESTKDLRLIANELGVAHILEGSVRRAGDRLRITAQLIRASDGFHLWSENYDRDAADVIDVQEDLAVKIASVMQTTMDPEALKDMLRVGTQSVDAYQAYLRGLALNDSVSNTGNELDYLAAYEKFEEARTIDTSFSAAHYSAAQFWSGQASPTSSGSGITNATAAEIRDNYLLCIDLAIETANNPVDKRFFEAEKAFFQLRLRRALALFEGYLKDRPNDGDAWDTFGDVATYVGDREMQLKALEHYAEAGKTQLWAAVSYAGDAYRAIDPSEAADYGLQALQRWPDSYDLLYQTHRSLMWAKRPDEATVLARRLDELYGFDPLVQAREACMAGRTDEVEQILEDMLAQEDQGGNLPWLVLLMLDRKEEAADLLKAFESTETPQTIASWLVYHKFDPSPYPVLMEIMQREGVTRPPPVEIPYTCGPDN